MADNKPDKDEAARIIEDAEEGPHGRLDDPNTPPEMGPIERGRVDAGPTGTRGNGYREPESASRIGMIAGAAIVVILIVVAVAYFR